MSVIRFRRALVVCLFQQIFLDKILNLGIFKT